MHDDDLDRLCSLTDPTRRRLYEHLVDRRGPVTRDEASAATGIDRSVAAYHLDKLAEEGWLTTSFARPRGRGGPGAGRPAKHYAVADVERSASEPPRDYLLVARLLARAVEGDASGAVRQALDEAARELGRSLPARGGASDAWTLLRDLGYRPHREDGELRLGNCPFHRLASEHTDLVCGMNLALFEGLLEALDDDAHEASLDPRPGQCCVALRLAAASRDPAT